MDGTDMFETFIRSGKKAIFEALTQYQNTGGFEPFIHGLAVTPLFDGSVRFEPFGNLRDDAAEPKVELAQPTVSAPKKNYRRPVIFYSENGENRKINIELPGIEPDQIKLDLVDNQLVLEAVSDRPVANNYSAHVPLPVNVMPADVRAYYHDAILEIVLPGTEPGTRVGIAHRADSATLQRVEQLEAELKHAKEAAETSAQQVTDLKKECETLNRRARAEKQQFSDQRVAQTLYGFLDVIDNFDRALEICNTAKDVRTIAHGVQMIHDQFMAALRQHGVQPIVSEGRKFDVNFHDAIKRVPRNDLEPNTIVQEIVKGYTLNNTVLRPAKVVIAYNPDQCIVNSTKSV